MAARKEQDAGVMPASVKIHPTAIVDARAELADDVEIGPFAFIDGPVHLGRSVRIAARASLCGETRLGEGVQVGIGAIIGGDPQDLGFDMQTASGVEIGPHAVIREYVTIHRATQAGGATRVGPRAFLMGGCHLGHDCDVGEGVIIANNCLLAGHVHVGAGSFLGGGSVFHQFIRIGRLAMVRGSSGFGKDVPPFTIGFGVNQVAGLNSIGLRRAGLPAQTRKNLREAFKLIFRSGLNVSQALAATGLQSHWTAESSEFFDFIRLATKRGIVRCSKSSDDSE